MSFTDVCYSFSSARKQGFPHGNLACGLPHTEHARLPRSRPSGLLPSRSQLPAHEGDAAKAQQAVSALCNPVCNPGATTTFASWGRLGSLRGQVGVSSTVHTAELWQLQAPLPAYPPLPLQLQPAAAAQCHRSRTLKYS